MFEFEKFLNIGLNESQVKAMKGVYDNLTAKSGEKTLTDILEDLKKFNNVEPIVEDASAATIIKKSNGFISMINEADDDENEDEDEDEDMEDFEESDNESESESEEENGEESASEPGEEPEESESNEEPGEAEENETPEFEESEENSEEDVLEPISDEESEPSDMESEPMSDENMEPSDMESEPESEESMEPSDMESEPESEESMMPIETEPDGDEVQGGVADGSHPEPDGDEVQEPTIPSEQNSSFDQGYINGVFDRGFEIGYEAGFNDKGYYNAVVKEGDENFNEFLKQLQLYEEDSSPKEEVKKAEVKPMTPKTESKPQVKPAVKKEVNKEIKNEVKPIKPITPVGEKMDTKPEVKKEVTNESFYNAIKGQGSEQYKNTIDNLFKGYVPNLNKQGTPEQMKIQEELKATRRQLIVEQYLNSISPLKRSKMRAVVESLASKISDPESLKEALILLPVDAEPKQKINESVTPVESTSELNENNKYNSKEEEKIVENTMGIFNHLIIPKDKGKK